MTRAAPARVAGARWGNVEIAPRLADTIFGARRHDPDSTAAVPSIVEELPRRPAGRKCVRTGPWAKFSRFQSITKVKADFYRLHFPRVPGRAHPTPRSLGQIPCRPAPSLMTRTGCVPDAKGSSVSGCNDEHEQRALREARVFRADGLMETLGAVPSRPRKHTVTCVGSASPARDEGTRAAREMALAVFARSLWDARPRTSRVAGYGS